MKRIVTFILLIGMILSFAACTDTSNKTPEVTPQEIYDAGKDFLSLLGDHVSVHLVYSEKEGVFREEYLTEDFSWQFLAAGFQGLETEYASFVTQSGLYTLSDNIYSQSILMTPSGMQDPKTFFEGMRDQTFLSAMLLDDTLVITEENGSIIATATADANEVAEMEEVQQMEGLVGCEEIYTLDANTRELTSVKTVYTFADGTKDEGIVTISYDVEVPEKAKEFLAYATQTENLRTVTFVSNPGTAEEKMETVMAPKGLVVAPFPADFDRVFNLYTDAACTQLLETEPDANSDFTYYIKWEEQQAE